MPNIISSLKVSPTAAFFIAYGVVSIPAGLLAERFTEKLVMITAFLA